jgi:TrmH family RNA methyltransferase
MHLRVVLVEPEHDGNIGGVARLMENFGIQDLYIVNPAAPVDDEAKAYACHARQLLEKAKTVARLDEALEDVSLIAGTTALLPKRSANVLRTAITPEEFSRIALPLTGNVALLLGRESRGLSNAELDRCDLVISIPASRMYRTLNVASAAAILFYVLWRAGEGGQHRQIREADEAIKSRLAEVFDQLCDESLVIPYKRRLADRAFRSLLSRATVSAREATLILGALRQAVQRIQGVF